MRPQHINDISQGSDTIIVSDLLHDTEYNRSAQSLNLIISRLRDCGTEQVVPLPKIAVVGNQSAGKSSLIEAISQIKVPRASGTCTRCPMEVILRSGMPSDWSCRVSLRKEYENGVKLGLPQITTFGETTVKGDVTELLRRAQLANLNPLKKSQYFMVGNHLMDIDPNAMDLQFSKNVVVVEISGASADVTFIDLPGIVSNVANVLSHNLNPDLTCIG